MKREEKTAEKWKQDLVKETLAVGQEGKLKQKEMKLKMAEN